MGSLSFQLHPITLVACLCAILLYRHICGSAINHENDSDLKTLLIDDVQNKRPNKLFNATSKQVRFFAGGLSALFIANFWPLAEIAQHDLLIGRMVQQLLISLAASPLLLKSLPRQAIVRLTKPRYFDLMLVTLTRPLPSVIIFSIVAISAISPPLVRFEAQGTPNDIVIQLAVFLASLLVWTPLLKILPGVRQLSTAGRLAYVFVLSLVPSIPAVVLIFAKRSLYSTYSNGAFGISAVGDQELTGALAKIASLAVFWSIAIIILLRADRDEEFGIDPDPITWDDVKRELDRSSKKHRYN